MKFLKARKDYFDTVLDLIEKAESRILIATYIFKRDELTERLFDALKKKALEGVEVKVLIDDSGSENLPRSWVATWPNYDIQVCLFNPIKWWRIGRGQWRLHYKLFVIDHQAIVSGINIGKEYLDPKQSDTWLDYGLLFPLKGEDYIPRLFANHWKNEQTPFLQRFPNLKEPRIFVNEGRIKRFELVHHYHRLIRNAREEIVIVNSYFHPRPFLVNALVKALLRGVAITLVLPEKSDVPVVDFAARGIGRQLAKLGVKVYFWDKSILHAKVALVDRKLLSVGSFNLHFTSMYNNIEMNALTKNPEVVQDSCQELEEVISLCRPYGHQGDINQIGLVARLKCELSLVLHQVVFWISTRIRKS